MKKLIPVLTLAAVLTLTACGGGSKSQSSTEGGAKKVSLKIGHTLADTSHYQKGMEKFKELVEQKSNGTLTLQVFPNGSLGGERDMIEGLNVGSLDMVLTSTAPMNGFVPEVSVVDLPFLFRDADHAHKVLDGEVGQDLRKKVETKLPSVTTLAWWENGFRNVTNKNAAINKPEDLKGIKIRIQENPIHSDTFKSFGAQPTPMSFTELFTALQQGVIDAQENPVPVIYTSRFNEVQKHLTMTRHFYSPSLLMISKNSFNGLTPEQQKALTEAAVEAGKYERQVVQDMEKQYLTELAQKGMTINEKPDIQPFVDAVKPVYDKYQPQFGELIKKIQDVK